MKFNGDSDFNPLAATDFNAAGAFLTSSSVNKCGLIVACGHTYEHWLHCIQFSGIHSGTLTAVPLFSNAAVPFSKVPSSISMLTKAETGRESPSNLFIGSTIFFIKSDFATLSAFGASSWAFFHSAGTSILTKASIPLSIAAWFMFTTFSPFLPYEVTTASFKYLTASSTGIMLASLKNAACIIMLILPPRPISCAILTAFNV